MDFLGNDDARQGKGRGRKKGIRFTLLNKANFPCAGLQLVYTKIHDILNNVLSYAYSNLTSPEG